jgi:hypothetical protein
MKRITEVEKLQQEMLKQQMLDEAGIVGQLGSALLSPLAQAAGATALGYGAAMIGKRLLDRTRALRAGIARKIRLWRGALYQTTVNRFLNNFRGANPEKIDPKTCQALAKLWGNGINPEVVPDAVAAIKRSLFLGYASQRATEVLVKYLKAVAADRNNPLNEMAKDSLQRYEQGISGMFKYDNHSFLNTAYGETTFALSAYRSGLINGFSRLVKENNFGVLFPQHIPTAVFIANPVLSQALNGLVRKDSEEAYKAWYDEKSKQSGQQQSSGTQQEQPQNAAQGSTSGTSSGSTSGAVSGSTPGVSQQQNSAFRRHPLLRELAEKRLLEAIEGFLREAGVQPDPVENQNGSQTTEDPSPSAETPGVPDDAQENPEEIQAQEPETPSPDAIETSLEYWRQQPIGNHPVAIWQTKAMVLYCRTKVVMVYFLGMLLARRGLLTREGQISSHEDFMKFAANMSMSMLQTEFETAKANFAGQKYQAADDDKANRQRRLGSRNGGEGV